MERRILPLEKQPDKEDTPVPKAKALDEKTVKDLWREVKQVTCCGW